MTDDSLKKCLTIMENHVAFLEKHKNDGILSEDDYDYFIDTYKKGIKEGYEILKETN